MTPDSIAQQAPAERNLKLRQGNRLFSFLTAQRLSKGIELRNSPSITTAYLAGALHEIGEGSLLSIRQGMPRPGDYDIQAALAATELTRYVSFEQHEWTYNWPLMKLLREDGYETLDFCLIDGGGTWSEVGFAVCLVERLLRPGGWVIVNNLDFSFRQSRVKDKPWVTSRTEDEQVELQVERVFQLLLQSSPHFGTFRRSGAMAWAQKRQSLWSAELRTQHRKETLICSIVERAQHDPDFRVALLNSPAETLRADFGADAEQLQTLHFVDSNDTTPAVGHEGESAEDIVYLDRPSWEHRTDEKTLLRMLGNTE